MFNAYVLQIPTYIIMSKLGWIDTYLALMVPAFALPMGLFLMKQFMEQIPDALIEAAKIDGAKEGRIFLQIVMPNVKPAWLTVTIFSVQNLWNMKGQVYIYSEEYKILPYALQADYGRWCCPCRCRFRCDNGRYDGADFNLCFGRE